MRPKDRRETLLSALFHYRSVLDIPENLWDPKGASRRVDKRSRVTKRAKLPSSKMGSVIPCESVWELARATLAEVTPNILAYVTQPCAIPGMGRQAGSYFPDFAVITLDHKLRFEEIKPDRILQDQNELERFGRIKSWLAEHGIGFELLTSSALSREPRLSNCRLLARYSDSAPTADIAAQILKKFAEGPQPISAFNSDPTSPNGSVASVFHLIIEGLLTTDLDIALSSQSIIALAT